MRARDREKEGRAISGVLVKVERKVVRVQTACDVINHGKREG